MLLGSQYAQLQASSSLLAAAQVRSLHINSKSRSSHQRRTPKLSCRIREPPATILACYYHAPSSHRVLHCKHAADLLCCNDRRTPLGGAQQMPPLWQGSWGCPPDRHLRTLAALTDFVHYFFDRRTLQATLEQTPPPCRGSWGCRLPAWAACRTGRRSRQCRHWKAHPRTQRFSR